MFAKQRWNFKVYPAGKTSESSDSDCDDDDDINNNGDFCLYLELFENPKRKTSKPMVNLKVLIVLLVDLLRKPVPQLSLYCRCRFQSGPYRVQAPPQ